MTSIETSKNEESRNEEWRCEGMPDYSNWMSNTPQLYAKPFVQVCLPATHDSGTSDLTTSVPDGSPEYLKIVTLIQDVASLLNKIPGIGQYINPAQWVANEITPAIRGISVATTKTIAEQLRDGIRCFDLRVYYNKSDQQYYTYHGLMGSQITPGGGASSCILEDLANFLANTSGEILYVTMGHWLGFSPEPNPPINPPPAGTFGDFANRVMSVLGKWAFVRSPDDSDPFNVSNPFKQTYWNIVHQGGTKKSRVILVNGTSEDYIFWPQSYSPPDNGATGTVIAGFYTDTDQLSTMVPTQSLQLRNDLNDSHLPFALYMTLTPSTTDSVAIIASSLAGAVAALGAAYPPLALFLEPVALLLKAYKVTTSWTTLAQLAQVVDANLVSTIDGIVQSAQLSPGAPNPLSIIYTDFYETTPIVDYAIQRSSADPTPALFVSIPGAIVQIWNNNSQLGLSTFASQPAHGYVQNWSNPTMHQGFGAVAWLAVAATGTGSMGILQLWDANGHLGMILYSPQSGGGFAQSWSTIFAEAGFGAITWLTGSVDGSGKTDVFQLWANADGNLGLTIYTPQDGAYQIAWSLPDMGQSSQAVAWLTVDTAGNGVTSLLQLLDAGSDGQLGMRLYAPQSGGGYGLSWSSTFAEAGFGAIAWLTGSADGSGKTDVFQLWGNTQGNLGLTIYTPQNGGYQVAWSSPDMGQPSEAVAWLTVDTAGNGVASLLQLLDAGPNGQLGMRLYAPKSGGGYEMTWSTVFPEAGYGAVQWLTAKQAGSSRTDVVQLWNANGKLGVTVYSPQANGGFAVAWSGVIPDASPWYGGLVPVASVGKGAG